MTRSEKTNIRHAVILAIRWPDKPLDNATRHDRRRAAFRHIRARTAELGDVSTVAFEIELKAYAHRCRIMR